jgi:Protein of unknown function (DUF3105)
VNHRTTIPERIAIGLASLALSLGLIALLSGFFAGRDAAGVSGGTATVAGQRFPDQGDVHLGPGDLRPPYNSDPPTSGPHLVSPVVRQGAALRDDGLLTALEVGDVVIVYGTPQPPAALMRLADAVGGRFTPALAAAGQAVVLMRQPGTVGVIALAWTRMLRVASANDPALVEFAQQWLGRGAPRH